MAHAVVIFPDVLCNGVTVMIDESQIWTNVQFRVSKLRSVNSWISCSCSCGSASSWSSPPSVWAGPCAEFLALKLESRILGQSFNPVFCSSMMEQVQSGASYLSQGFEDKVLGSSPGWLADTVATYCPGRPSQLTWKNITKSCDR